MRQMRLFVAINLPEPVKQVLGSFVGELRRLTSDARWVEQGNLHLTLKFLGNVPEEQVPAIIAALERSAAGVPPFRLDLGGVGVFPSMERPRVFWVGVSGETAALSRLHRQVQEEMKQLGFEPENRRFTPHLTLARLRSPLGFAAVLERADMLARQQGRFGSVKVASMELMLSELSPGGARYSVLAGFSLPGGVCALKNGLLKKL
ncbi:MAG: RNA 2',3'-cyclic phosphodiesterase [Peptococcaceae bacterium]|nr:RNA 2',3'-cyclic phosphodiesterase [Peptococcaceae bacterium]